MLWGKSAFNWNYNFYERVVRVVGALGILAHLVFYFSLHYDPVDVEGLITRLIMVSFFVPFLFYPRGSWKIIHKVYYELTIAVTMPGYFTYLLLLENSRYWAVTLIFIIINYGVLAKWQVAVVLYPLAVAGACGAAFLFHPPSPETLWDVLDIEPICLLALLLAQVLRTVFEAAYHTTTELKDKADEQNEIFSALLDISVEVSRFDDLDEIFHLLLKRFETIFPGRGFGLLVEGPRPKIIPHMAFRGLSQKDSAFLLQVHPYVLGFASVDIGSDEEQLSSLEGDNWQVFGGGIRSSSIKGQTLYCFKLFIKGQRLDGDERKTLEVFLETIRGMTRSRIQAIELERYSNTDHLTGLYNRNYFDRVIKEWREKARPEKPFSVIFGDINGLKRINDTYGHQAGDSLIRSCAELLTQEVRNSDLVFRLGGDEIVILCPSTDLGQAEELLKRISASVTKLIVPCVDEVSGKVSAEQVHISFGSASSVEQGPGEVVALADKRMFDNKKSWYNNSLGQRYR